MDDELYLIAKEFLEKVTSELDPFTKTDGVIKKEGNKAILLTPSHIQFAKYGRGPGKKPPLDPILKWVKSEGIIFDGTSEKGTAFAIQASIGKKGTKNWVKGAPNALTEAITNNIDSFNKAANNSMSVVINDLMIKEYEKIFPPKIEVKL